MHRLLSSYHFRGIPKYMLGMPWRLEAYGVVPPEIPSYRGCGRVGYNFDAEATLRYLDAYMAEAGIKAPFMPCILHKSVEP